MVAPFLKILFCTVRLRDDGDEIINNFAIGTFSYSTARAACVTSHSNDKKMRSALQNSKSQTTHDDDLGRDQRTED